MTSMAAEGQNTIDTKGLKQEHIAASRSGEGHAVSFDIDGLPDEIYVGDTVALVLFGQCQSGCSLVNDKVSITDQSGAVVATSTFVGQEDDLAYTDSMLITVPDTAGDYQYRIIYEPAPLPLPDDGGPAFPNPHKRRELLLVLTVKEHHVALSTWGLTSPVFVNETVEVTVGASCSDGCSLDGCSVEVYDAEGAKLAAGKLLPPEEPRPKLWWAKLSATAPAEAKLHRWEARFVADGLSVPHEAGVHKFSFVAKVRPEREFKALVIDEKTQKPLRSARVEIKPTDGGKAQFASTNAEGEATIGCAKGTYDLKITSPSKKNFTETLNLEPGDLSVEVHMQPTSSTDDRIPMKVLSGGAPSAAPDETATTEATAKPEAPKAE